MKKIFWLLCLIVKEGVAQIPQYNNVTLYNGNFIYLTQRGPTLAVTRNPALLGENKLLFAGFITENRFLVKEMAFHQFITVIPMENASLGCGLSSFGSKDYNENSINLFYGKKLGQVSVGVEFIYQIRSIAGHGKESRPRLAFGVNWIANDRIQTGFKLATGSQKGYPFARSIIEAFELNAHINITVTENASIGALVEKYSSNAGRLTLAILYQPHPKISCKTGVITEGFSPWLAVGFQHKKFLIEINSTYHGQLGPSPGISLVYQIKNKKQ